MKINRIVDQTPMDDLDELTREPSDRRSSNGGGGDRPVASASRTRGAGGGRQAGGVDSSEYDAAYRDTRNRDDDKGWYDRTKATHPDVWWWFYVTMER